MKTGTLQRRWSEQKPDIYDKEKNLVRLDIQNEKGNRGIGEEQEKIDGYGYYEIEIDRNIHLATDSEKQQLFDAIEKEGKRWDSEKKEVVNLKPKVELKPFDRVLVRDFEDQAWQVSLFSYKDSDSYYCCNGCAWNQCIPYIGNESLLGTTKDVEG